MTFLKAPDGARIWWTSVGEGEPVILVMGLGYPSDMWFRITPVLARHYRVLLLDNRGAGRTGDVPGAPYSVETMAHDVAAVLEAAGESSAHVVGASLGGLVAQELAITMPDKVRTLVLACTHPGVSHAVWDPQAIAFLTERASLTPQQAAEASIPFNYADGTPRERIEEDWAMRLPLACTPAGYLAQAQGTASWSGLERLSSVHVPTLVLHGEDDRLVPAENGRRIAARIPGAELVLIPDANHLFFTDQPELTHEALLAWLSRHRNCYEPKPTPPTPHRKMDRMTQVERYAAFTSDPAGGNPAGVVLDADDLDEARMQQIAADVGYSETAFVLRAGREEPHYGLRFFSPLAEVAFCGHATIATGVALVESGAAGPFRFETQAGDLKVSTKTDARGIRASLRSVPAHSRPVSPRALQKALRALGWAAEDLDPDYPPHVAYAGNDHLVLAARTRQRLSDLDYDFAALQELAGRESWTTLQLVWPDGDSEFHSRNPFPAGGVVEDPATGAAAAALGAYLRQIGRLPPASSFTVIQGEDMGRPSQLDVTVDANNPGVTVSGAAVPIPPALQAPPTKTN